MVKNFVKNSCTIVCTYFLVACGLDPKKSHFCILVPFWIFKPYVDSSGLLQSGAHFFALFGDFAKKPSQEGRPLGEGTIGEGAV